MDRFDRPLDPFTGLPIGDWGPRDREGSDAPPGSGLAEGQVELVIHIAKITLLRNRIMIYIDKGPPQWIPVPSSIIVTSRVVTRMDER